MDASYLLWQAEGEPLTIEFSRLTIEQVRQTCFAATNGVLRGGKGVGGLLFGTRLGSHWRVLAWRPIECSYPRGEAFHLSGGDERLLEASLSAPPPAGTTLVGWFASHPRGGLLLSPEERRIHSVFFSVSERLMITMRATRSGELAMAIHLTAEDEPSTLRVRTPELSVAPMSRPDFESAVKGDGQAKAGAESAGGRAPLPAPVRTTYVAVGFSGVLVATAAIAVLGWQLTQTGLLPLPERLAAKMRAPSRLLSVQIGHAGSSLDVNWDPRAYESSEPAFASVVYASQSYEKSVELDRESLQAGHVTIAVDEQPASVTVSIRTAEGKSLKETVRFVAPPGRENSQKK